MLETKELIRQLNAVLGDDALDAVLRRMRQPKIRKSKKESYHSFLDDGVSLRFDRKSALKTICLYPGGREGFSKYQGALPSGVTFSDGRDEVVRKLGAPTASGGGGRSALYGVVPQWVRYDLSGYTVHFEFHAETGGVSLVTIMASDSVP